MNRGLIRFRFLFLVVSVALLIAVALAHAQEGRRLRAGYASLSGNMAPYWAAKDAAACSKNMASISIS